MEVLLIGGLNKKTRENRWCASAFVLPRIIALCDQKLAFFVSL
jgi:hypothetical protein